MFLALAALVMITAAVLLPQGAAKAGDGGAPSWTQVAPRNAPPPARTDAVLALDGGGNRLFVHGGQSDTGILGDLWQFDLAANRWRRLMPSGPKPAPRFGHAAAWDERRGRLIVFAGQGNGGFFSDVWAYSPVRNRWTQLAKDNAGPNRRYGTCAGYDRVGDRMLISHGITSSGRFDDTWAFALGSRRWTDISPEGARPVKRCLHACGWDPKREALVLFGGQTDGAAQLGDTWRLVKDTWLRHRTVPKPSARRLAGAAHPGGGGLVLFGGIGRAVEGDTWSFDAVTPRWQRIPTAASPPARYSHATAASPLDPRVFVFGGSTGSAKLNDLWVLAGSDSGRRRLGSGPMNWATTLTRDRWEAPERASP